MQQLWNLCFNRYITSQPCNHDYKFLYVLLSETAIISFNLFQSTDISLLNFLSWLFVDLQSWSSFEESTIPFDPFLAWGLSEDFKMKEADLDTRSSSFVTTKPHEFGSLDSLHELPVLME
ncbi:hypothetical protein L1987_75694 [Smallanthus sonchifolius]|uniref:Uncharacterized protein n=1 Tax=Smallanthus sonchifolius TaxID=185202 RepID=A0ACB9A660_9ASTR|nr:hypothetical protein L1987_75694 [Smallanthus sonchifolius]